MFYHASREGLVDPSKSIQVGMRTNNADEAGFTVVDCARAHAEGPTAVAHEIRRVVGDGPAYISFDIDCLDPAYAPGTGTPVCGGLSTWQAREILFRLTGLNLVGMDVVEVSPPYDHAQITALAGATIASDLLCLYAHGERGGRSLKG
jgi:agmatinase